MAPLATLVLDLDGTIVDSLPDLTAALNRLMTARSLPTFPAPSVAAMVGDGTTKLVERAFAARSREAQHGDIDAFVADYTAHATVATRAYPGVEETLGRLKTSGWQFAICTNKTIAATHAVLDALGLAHWFAALGCGDTFPVRKPNPAHLVGTLDAAGGDRRRAVMVGDHANDIAVAKGAGVPSIFAAWGYGARSMAEGASAIGARFTDLAGLAPSLLP
jgi:phosphoglycolate phosphatase